MDWQMSKHIQHIKEEVYRGTGVDDTWSLETIPNQIRCIQDSKVATGVVLTQLDSNGNRHPCSFISKTLSPTEQNYRIYDR